MFKWLSVPAQWLVPGRETWSARHRDMERHDMESEVGYLVVLEGKGKGQKGGERGETTCLSESERKREEGMGWEGDCK